MNVPDLISPIVGYRAWKVNLGGKLTAITNGVPWPPGNKVVAECTSDSFWVVGHVPPMANCRCGLYAAKNFDKLLDMGYMDDTIDAVWGEVNLWGTVIEHSHGYRAQFAYPRKLIVPYRGFPFKLLDVEGRVEQYAKYKVPIYFKNKLGEFLLWHPETGIHNIDQLVDMKQKSFVKLKIPELVPGTRVWFHVPQEYAIVQRMTLGSTHLFSSNKRIDVAVKDIFWDEANNRWVVYTTRYFVRGL